DNDRWGANGTLRFSKVSKITLPSAVADTRVTEFVYNFVGDMTDQKQTLYNFSDPATVLRTRWFYDDRGRLTKKTDARESATFPADYSFFYSDYNSFGQARTVNYWVSDDGSYGPPFPSDRYSYDNRGNLTSLIDRNGNVTTYTYNALNLRTSIVNP